MIKLTGVVVTVVGAAAFLLNPLYACGQLEPRFDFGAAELTAAVEGQWRITLTAADGTRQTAVLDVHQGTGAQHSRAAAPRPIASAHACGDRTLIQSAGACENTTTMPLRIARVSGDLAGPFRGELLVFGTAFERGFLRLQLGTQELTAQIAPSGALLSVVSLGAQGASATALRIAAPN